MRKVTTSYQTSLPAEMNGSPSRTAKPVQRGSAAVQAKPARKPFSPDADLINLGFRLVEKIVNGRKWEPLRPYIKDTNSASEGTMRNGTAVLLGVAMRGARILEQVECSGLARFTGASLPSVDDLVYSFKTDHCQFIGRANQITDALATVMRALPGMKIEASRPAATKQEEAGAMKVEIVGLPDRLTTTAITRDEAGNIASSAQLERDV